MVKIKFVVFVSLLLAVLLLSGCTVPQAQTPEEKAKALADQTVEGKLIAAMNQSFGKMQDCTVDEFVAVVNATYAAQGAAQLPEPSEEQKVQIAAELEKAKSCAPSVEKDVSAIEGNKYKVAYSFSFPSGCKEANSMSADTGSVFMEVDVDIEAGSAEVVKGAIPEAQKEQTIAQAQAMGLMGNCGAALLLMPLAAAPVSPQQQE